MTDVFLSGNFLRNTRGLAVGDGGGVTWAFDSTTNKLTVASVSGSALGAGSVANSNLANMAQSTVKGRAAGAGTGAPVDLTATHVKAILALVSTDISDFTEAAQDAIGALITASATISPSYNDVGNVLTMSVIDGTITYAKMQNVSAANRVLGRITAGAGVVEELTGANLATIIGTSLGANPSVTIGLTAKNGTAGTYHRSDSAPALDVSILPTWTGAHVFTPTAGSGITVNAFTGTTGLFVNGVASNYAAQVVGVNSAGVSRGLRIQAGTNASDFAFVIANAANTGNLLTMDGLGVATWTAKQVHTVEGQNLVLKGDISYLDFENAAGTSVLQVATVKGWLGSGTNVTDAAIGAIKNLNFYTNGGATAALTIDTTGAIGFGIVATTATAPAAGGAGALPATPLGYVTLSINGTARKLAYYA